MSWSIKNEQFVRRKPWACRPFSGWPTYHTKEAVRFGIKQTPYSAIFVTFRCVVDLLLKVRRCSIVLVNKTCSCIYHRPNVVFLSANQPFCQLSALKGMLWVKTHFHIVTPVKKGSLNRSHRHYFCSTKSLMWLKEIYVSSSAAWFWKK